MGNKQVSTTDFEGDGSYDVLLHVYDIGSPILFRLNDILYHFGLGSYHVGVEVHGREYIYMTSGVNEHIPLEVPLPNVRYRTTVYVGRTKEDSLAVRRHAHHLGSGAFQGSHYLLLHHNCVTFARQFSRVLGVARGFPSWPDRIARFASLFVSTELEPYVRHQSERLREQSTEPRPRTTTTTNGAETTRANSRTDRTSSRQTGDAAIAMAQNS